MTKAPPERATISFPTDDDGLDLDELDELVRASEYDSRSAFIRAAVEERAEDNQGCEQPAKDSA